MNETKDNSRPGYRERDELYRLIISQLFYDGHQQVAVNLSTTVKAHPACPPADRLLHLINLGLEAELAQKGKRKRRLSARPDYTGPGIDLDMETSSMSGTPEAALYETLYVTAHKNHCRACAFNPSGSLICTGSEDASIKILDVEKMLAKSSATKDHLEAGGQQVDQEAHPVIRTLYDHIDEVTTLDFHPTNQILASGSKDETIRFFDYSKSSAKRSTKTLKEAYPIRNLAFHPGGDHMLVATSHPTLRMYDANTFQCYVSSDPADQHKEPITSVRYSLDGRIYATSSEDGDIRVWDGVSNRCVNTFPKAHDGQPVSSVRFSRNYKYILSSGKDSVVKLWELSANRCLIAYTGAGVTGKQQFMQTATFNHTEDYVFFPDEKTISLCCWDSRNAERQKLLALGHNDSVRAIEHSPTSPAFITCSDDFRARFWYKKPEVET